MHPTPVQSLSSEPDTIRVPSLEKATELTDPVWPLSTFSFTPVDASHTCTELSYEPDTICVPSLENATELDRSSVALELLQLTPVDASHTRTV
jgi:hypothetical protein